MADYSEYSKRFTWFDQGDVLTCPVTHLVALAIHDNTFKLPQLNDAYNIFFLTLPKGAKQIVLHWRDDVLDRPILRISNRSSLDKELPSNIAAKRFRSLGEKMGFRYPLTWYCLRRLVLNTVDGP